MTKPRVKPSSKPDSFKFECWFTDIPNRDKFYHDGAVYTKSGYGGHWTYRNKEYFKKIKYNEICYTEEPIRKYEMFFPAMGYSKSSTDWYNPDERGCGTL